MVFTYIRASETPSSNAQYLPMATATLWPTPTELLEAAIDEGTTKPHLSDTRPYVTIHG
jgi:hypothetical protein